MYGGDWFYEIFLFVSMTKTIFGQWGTNDGSMLRSPPKGFNSVFYDWYGTRSSLGALASGGMGGLGGIGGGGNPFGTGLGTMGGSSPFNSGVGGLNGLNWLGSYRDNQGSGVPFGRQYVPSMSPYGWLPPTYSDWRAYQAAPIETQGSVKPDYSDPLRGQVAMPGSDAKQYSVPGFLYPQTVTAPTGTTTSPVANQRNDFTN